MKIGNPMFPPPSPLTPQQPSHPHPSRFYSSQYETSRRRASQQRALCFLFMCVNPTWINFIFKNLRYSWKSCEIRLGRHISSSCGTRSTAERKTDSSSASSTVFLLFSLSFSLSSPVCVYLFFSSSSCPCPYTLR